MLITLPSSLFADHDDDPVEAPKPYMYQPTSSSDALTQIATEGEYTMIVKANKFDLEDKTHANRHALRNARKKAEDLLYIMNKEFDMHYTRLKLGAPLHVTISPTEIRVLLGGDHNGKKTRIMYTGKVQVVWKVLSIVRYDYNYWYNSSHGIKINPRYDSPPGKITYGTGNIAQNRMRRRMIKHRIDKGSKKIKDITDCLIKNGIFDKE